MGCGDSKEWTTHCSLVLYGFRNVERGQSTLFGKSMFAYAVDMAFAILGKNHVSHLSVLPSRRRNDILIWILPGFCPRHRRVQCETGDHADIARGILGTSSP